MELTIFPTQPMILSHRSSNSQWSFRGATNHTGFNYRSYGRNRRSRVMPHLLTRGLPPHLSCSGGSSFRGQRCGTREQSRDGSRTCRPLASSVIRQRVSRQGALPATTQPLSDAHPSPFASVRCHPAVNGSFASMASSWNQLEENE